MEVELGDFIGTAGCLYLACLLADAFVPVAERQLRSGGGQLDQLAPRFAAGNGQALVVVQERELVGVEGLLGAIFDKRNAVEELHHDKDHPGQWLGRGRLIKEPIRRQRQISLFAA